MTVVRLFLSVLFALLLFSGFIILNKESPEKDLIGQWEEVSWEYEKVNHDGTLIDFQINDGQQEEIRKNLLIHKSEIWSFFSDHTLDLKTIEGTSEKVVWNLKGRGHILELEHEGKRVEDYQIQYLSPDSMIIHFNFDLQVRGIVKMTFKRKMKEEYAQKI